MSILNSVFDFIFGKIESIDDPFFGKLLHTGEGFEGKKTFAPTGLVIEVFIDEQKNKRITQEQIDFYRWVEEHYDRILLELKPKIELEERTYIDGYQIEDLDTDLKLAHLSIPDINIAHPEWELVFYEQARLNHYLTVVFRQNEVLSIHMDG